MSGATLSEGRVVSGHGRHYVVEAGDGRRILCHPRGKKSDCVVGDRVRWRASADEGVIEATLPRRNLVFRRDDWRTKAFAANIDQLLVVVAVEPVFSESQLARALIGAGAAGVPAVIALNKRDLPSFAEAAARLAPYAAMGCRHHRPGSEGRARGVACSGSRPCSPTGRRSSSARAAPARARSSTSLSPTRRRRSERSRGRSGPAGTRRR